MKFLRILMIGLVLIVLSSSVGYSFEQAQNRFRIEDITLQVFDRSTNKLFPLSPLPNPYGLDMDILASVKVRGNPTAPPAQAVPPQQIKLAIDAKGFTTAATGRVSPWKETQTRSLFIPPDKETSYIPFLAEYKCYPNVVFTASLSTSSKSKTLSLPCAE
jgi:hypothetical protein